MKRICFLFILMILLLSPLYPQKVIYSTKQKINNKTPHFSVIGKNSDGIVLRRYGKTTNILDIFDNNLNYKYSVPLNPRRQNAYTKGVLLNQYGATVLFLAPYRDYVVLYARVLTKNFELSGGTEIPLDTIYDNRDNVFNNYRYALSKDKSKILFYYPFYRGDQLVSLKAKVFTRDLFRVNKKKIKVPEELSSDYLSVHEIIKNNGEVLLYMVKSDRSEKNGYSIKDIHQHFIGQNGYRYDRLKFEIISYGNVHFNYDEINEKVTMAGLKSGLDKKSRRSSSGYYINYINAESAIIESSLEKSYRNEFMYELTGKDSSKHSNQLSTFNLKKVVLRYDGGVILILESYFTENDQFTFPGSNPTFSSFRTYNVFYYNDIVCFSVDSNCEEEWHSILRKKQVSENDNGIHSSYGLLIENDVLHFVYLGEIYYNANVSSYTVQSNGDLRRSVLFSQNEEDVMLITRLSRQISKDAIVIPSLRKNMLSMVKIIY